MNHLREQWQQAVLTKEAIEVRELRGSPLPYDRYNVNVRFAFFEGSSYAPEVMGNEERMEQAYKNWRARNPGRRTLDSYKDPTRWVPAGYTYFSPQNSDPGMVAFADLEVHTSPQYVRIAYMAVRPDHRGRGLARRLVQEIYARWPEATVHWGKMMDPGVGHLYNDFRQRYPERTTGGAVYF